MGQMEAYFFLFGIIVVLGHFFRASSIPIALIFVATGILISFLPFFPKLNLDPDITLKFFLPLLLYEASAFSSWRDIKKNFRPIALLSIGHVIFITVLVALVIHTLIPQLGWPLSFILGAVVSPPDDLVIFSIAENIRIPDRVFTILEGEAMFNDAAALILFRFALVALLTHEFSVIHATLTFVAIMVGETVYGLLLGNLIGQIRQRFSNTGIHIIASLLTPFLAYIPMVKLGGSGIVATAITGFIIGNQYSIRFTSEFRLTSQAIWPALAFALQSILFLLIGSNIRDIVEGISSIPIGTIMLYALSVTTVVIVGRFIWEFITVSLVPKVWSRLLGKKNTRLPWQYLFLISWAGMRGSISLAAVLSVPFLPLMINGVNPRDLIIFLVCCVIITTLILQGLTLPWFINMMGVDKHGQQEEYNEHLAEISAKIKMTKSALQWLKDYRTGIKNNPELLEEVKIYIKQYKIHLRQLKDSLLKHDVETLQHSDIEEAHQKIFVLSQIIEIEREELLKMWRLEKIKLSTRNKLMAKLDHQIQNIASI
jgi:CPA1 family monovalent cation:H+ antiporter